MSFPTSVGALAATLAFAASAQTPPQRVEWLPMFGPVVDKACASGPLQGRRPGELLPVPTHQKGKYIWAIGNTCEYSGFKVDPETGLPSEFVSKSEMLMNGVKPPANPLAGAKTLKEGWWQQSNLINQHPQTISVNPEIDATCQVKVGNTPPIRLSYNAVIIPDNHHAYLLRPSCKLELMIKMPEQVIAVSGGGIRNPGDLSLPPVATPAGTYINPSGFGDPIIAALFNLLGKYTDLMPAYRKDNCVILTYGMDKADTTRRAHNLTPEQAGALALEVAQQCRPCSPYTAGTIGYLGPHLTHDHIPFENHIHLFKVNQAPKPTCRCAWNKNTPDTVPPIINPSWVDLNGGFPELSPRGP